MAVPMFFLARDRDILFFGILLILVTAWLSIGYHHPDEHYQIWEFAKYKLGESPRQDLPWEFEAGMRPGLQPFLAYCAVLASRFVGLEDPFVQVAWVRLLTGLLAFGTYWKWCDALAPSMRDGGRLLRLSLAFFWLLPYLSVRFSSENLSGISFLGGLLLLYPDPQTVSAKKLFVAGLLLCLSFFFRYQIAFAGIGLVAWLVLVAKMPIRNWIYMAIGAMAAMAIGLSADRWLYGAWSCVPCQYFSQNILEGKASGFGVSPWWWYVTEFPLLMAPPLSLFLLWFMGQGVRRFPGHMLVWCLVPFVVGHSLAGHKEVRFLFPMIFPMFCLAAMGWDYFSREKTMPRWLQSVFKLSVVLNILLLLYRCLYPANDRFTYEKFMREYAVKHPGAVIYWQGKAGQKKETLTLHFFQTPWMNNVVTDSFSQLDDSTLYRPKTGDLICSRAVDINFEPKAFSMELAYKWFPDWVLQYNPNQWQQRTQIWKVFRVVQSSSD
jgi:GPI mannosyltransferase 3